MSDFYSQAYNLNALITELNATGASAYACGPCVTGVVGGNGISVSNAAQVSGAGFASTVSVAPTPAIDAAVPTHTKTLLCVVGDSISQLESNDNSTFTSGSVSNYPSQLAAQLGNTQLWNLGSPGAKAQDLINRIINQTNVLPACDVVIFEDGTNDTSPLLPSGSITSAYSTYQTLVNDVTAREPASTKYVFITVRQYGSTCSTASPCSAISNWNASIKSTASALGANAAVFDMETDSTWYQACGGTAPCFPDNVHPNVYAATQMATDLKPIVQGLSPAKSAAGTVTVAGANTQDLGSGSTVITAPVGRNLVLQSGQCAAGASSSCQTNIWLGGANGNDTEVCISDSRGNCLLLQTAGITLPLQYAGAPNPFIQSGSGAAGLDVYTPQLNFPECGQVWFGTNIASSMAPNGTCGSQGTIWAGQMLVKNSNNSGFVVQDVSTGGVWAGMLPGNANLSYPHDLVWYDMANNAAMAWMGDNTTNGDFALTKSTAHVSAPSGFIAGNSNSYAPAALTFGTGGAGFYTTLFDAASGSAVQGVTPTIFGIEYGPAGSPTSILALNGNGDAGIFGIAHAAGFQVGAAGGFAPQYLVNGVDETNPVVITGSCSVTAPSTPCSFANAFAFADTTFTCPSLSIEGATPQNAPTYDTKTTTGMTIHVTSSATVDYICSR